MGRRRLRTLPTMVHGCRRIARRHRTALRRDAHNITEQTNQGRRPPR
jgi:hypothetical protein